VKLEEDPPDGKINYVAMSSKPPGWPEAFSNWPVGAPAVRELTAGVASSVAASLAATWLSPAPRPSRACTGTQELVELPRDSEALEVRWRRWFGPPRSVRNRTLTLIEREDDTRSWSNFLVYFSHNIMPT
jgi:hypothetical protein